MIIQEYKIDSTIIKINNEYIGTKEQSKEQIDRILKIFIKINNKGELCKTNIGKK